MLKVWREAHLQSVRSQDPDLTSRQMSVLLSVYMTDPPHTVRGLSAELNVTKPVITRSLDTMGRMGLVKRKRDESDKRSVLIQRTVKGAVYLSELSDRILEADRAVPHDGE
ncbi:MAG: MarR family transcriptional regulator [Kordiimonadaceae bacterium]|nr:MarR family transcriptional regulator [Kordiimonadaceae bacterium]